MEPIEVVTCRLSSNDWSVETIEAATEGETRDTLTARALTSVLHMADYNLARRDLIVASMIIDLFTGLDERESETDLDKTVRAAMDRLCNAASDVYCAYSNHDREMAKKISKVQTAQ